MEWIHITVGYLKHIDLQMPSLACLDKQSQKRLVASSCDVTGQAPMPRVLLTLRYYSGEYVR